MEKAEEKKTITIKQGTGENAIEMNVLGTQEELNMMEQLRQNNPEKWTGKDLELLQEARKAIKDKAIGIESKPSNPNKTRHKVSGFDIGMICTVALLWLLLIIYKLALVSMQKEVNEFRSAVGGFDVTENYFSSRETGEFNGLFTGIGFADYGVLIPFTRLSDASAQLSLKHDIENEVFSSSVLDKLRDVLKVKGKKFLQLSWLSPKTDWFGYATEEMVYAVEDKEKEIPVGKQIQFAGLFPVAAPRYTICIVADKHSLDVNPSVFQDVVNPLATWLLK